MKLVYKLSAHSVDLVELYDLLSALPYHELHLVVFLLVKQAVCCGVLQTQLQLLDLIQLVLQQPFALIRLNQQLLLLIIHLLQLLLVEGVQVGELLQILVFHVKFLLHVNDHTLHLLELQG